jgi:lysophospholipase L1-like esterase
MQLTRTYATLAVLAGIVACTPIQQRGLPPEPSVNPPVPATTAATAPATPAAVAPSVAAPAPASPAASAAPTPTAEQLAAWERQRNDWPNFARYRQANAELGPPAPGVNRVVFMGNSITDAWARRFATDFPGKPYVGRGISGQTTPQMLVRFRQDVVDLKPKVVVILAGINDIAGNTGPSNQEMIADNIRGMTEIAKANGIRVVLSSVLPAYDFPWRPGMEPALKVIALNTWIKQYAQQAGVVYLDYHSKMADARGGLPPELATDGVHPTPKGYQIMAPLAEAAIQEAMAKKP